MKPGMLRVPRIFIGWIVLFFLHLILQYWMAEKHVVSAILAQGATASQMTIFGALAYVLLRFILYVVYPGIIVARLGSHIFRLATKNR